MKICIINCFTIAKLFKNNIIILSLPLKICLISQFSIFLVHYFEIFF